MAKLSSGIEKVICLGQFLGYCPKCQPHNGPERPNNGDCEEYTPVKVRYFKAVSSEEYDSRN